jgi:hypothetical protein
VNGLTSGETLEVEMGCGGYLRVHDRPSITPWRWWVRYSSNGRRGATPRGARIDVRGSLLGKNPMGVRGMKQGLPVGRGVNH